MSSLSDGEALDGLQWSLLARLFHPSFPMSYEKTLPYLLLCNEHLQRFRRAIALAQFFATPFMRIFSFYPPVAEGDPNGGKGIIDPANFIQCEQTPYPNAYQELCLWLCYVYVKDSLVYGAVVAAGEGVARWLEILQQLHTDCYDGFFSLEPHLAIAGKYQGFSGPDLFHKASQSFQRLLQ
jgi:hypothetical protein